jgi:hypothetical protein
MSAPVSISLPEFLKKMTKMSVSEQQAAQEKK